MSTSSTTTTGINDIGVAMFSVADQDAAIAFYSQKLGFELRADAAFGEDGAHRWVEVAPPGGTARLALNLPMGGEPGGASIGVETADLAAEHERLRSLGDVDVDPEPMTAPGAPPMFALRDPDGNHIWVVETPPAA